VVSKSGTKNPKKIDIKFVVNFDRFLNITIMYNFLTELAIQNKYNYYMASEDFIFEITLNPNDLHFCLYFADNTRDNCTITAVPTCIITNNNDDEVRILAPSSGTYIISCAHTNNFNFNIDKQCADSNRTKVNKVLLWGTNSWGANTWDFKGLFLFARIIEPYLEPSS
jgi:hypothetical protein